MIKSDLANGRASPVSDSSSRPGKKGTQRNTMHTHTHTKAGTPCLSIHTQRSLDSFKQSGLCSNPIRVKTDWTETLVKSSYCRHVHTDPVDTTTGWTDWDWDWDWDGATSREMQI